MNINDRQTFGRSGSWGEHREIFFRRCGVAEMPTVKRNSRKAVRIATFTLVLWVLPVHAQTASRTIKVLERLLAPFRSNPFRVDDSRPCGLGFATCFLPSDSGQPAMVRSAFDPVEATPDPSRVVTLELRTQHGGPFSHHWLQTQSSIGPVTLGFGPATIPFIDAGQVSLRDGHGNIERISGMYPIPVLGPPPVSYHYAKAPGSGHAIGKSVELTLAQSDALIQRERKHRFVGPYVPFFHDCRTYTCRILAAAKGRSSLPCYVLFRGYW
jgi:hypothetical protein